MTATKHFISLLILILFGLNSVQSQTFPQDWIGLWTGQLNIFAGPQKVDSLPMSLEISVTDTADQFNYYITYGTDENALRPYTLKIINAEKGHYLLDENNGISIEMYLIGTRIISSFEVMDNMIQSVTYRDGENLIYEIIAAGFKPVSITGDTIIASDTIPPVQTFPIRALQRAVLRRSKNISPN